MSVGKEGLRSQVGEVEFWCFGRKAPSPRWGWVWKWCWSIPGELWWSCWSPGSSERGGKHLHKDRSSRTLIQEAALHFSSGTEVEVKGGEEQRRTKCTGEEWEPRLLYTNTANLQICPPLLPPHLPCCQFPAQRNEPKLPFKGFPVLRRDPEPDQQMDFSAVFVLPHIPT